MGEACCSCEDVRSIVKEEIEKIFDAKVDELKGFAKSGKRAKRKPSQYNIFIGKCMKEDNKTMKQCAKEYKEKKAS